MTYENRPKIDWIPKYIEPQPQDGDLCPVCKLEMVRQGKYDPLCMGCHSVFKTKKGSQGLSGVEKPTTEKPGVTNEKLEEDLRFIIKELISLKELMTNLETLLIAKEIEPDGKPTATGNFDENGNKIEPV